MSDKKKHLFWMRVIAIFEAFKSILLLAVGFGLLSLINRSSEETADYLVKHLHLNPAHKYPHIFINFLSHRTSTEMWMITAIAFVDAIVRGAEAVGLWLERDWGKWLAIITAVLYLPIEIYEMCIHLTWMKTFTFVTNLLIVAYLGYILRSSPKETDEAQHELSPEPSQSMPKAAMHEQQV